MLRIWQSNKRKLFFCPIFLKFPVILRADNDNFGIPFHKLLILLTQLRHVPTAERSDESAIKNQNDMLFVLKIRKPKGLAIEIIQGKIRGWCVDLYA
jgi:hypothetical protein